MDEEYYLLLVQRYSEKKCTDTELEVFTHLLNEGKLDKYLTASMDKELGLQKDPDLQRQPTREKQPARIFPFLRRWQVAASILLFLALGLYLASRHHHSADPAIAGQPKQPEIKPGGNNAILTLGNGETIVLNKAKDGQLANQGHTTINKTATGQVVYTTPKTAPSEIIYNSITTPAGGQYQLVLSDGTKVWLNALSSIKYPTHFDNTQRTVEITGETYFEVAQNKTVPFRVITNNQTIDVLGTNFNINAYADESSTKTTLLEGKIRVTAASKAVILTPGQQAVANPNSLAVTTADTEEAIAWKNGYFELNNTDGRTMMRQITQ